MLCARNLSIYVSAMSDVGNRISYYRDKNGLEVDVIIELADGRW
jgi:predicted AAA+ superfamily ATPase